MFCYLISKFKHFPLYYHLNTVTRELILNILIENVLFNTLLKLSLSATFWQSFMLQLSNHCSALMYAPPFLFGQ